MSHVVTVINKYPKHILRTLYMSLTYPYCIYCNAIWGAGDKAIIGQVILLQKKSIRMIGRIYYNEHTEPLFISLNLLKLSQLNDLN